MTRQDDAEMPPVPEHLRSWPPALVKALGDPFEYAIGLRDGTVLRFEQATDLGHGWCRLFLMEHGEYARARCFPCPRGVDVRVADIVWAADAPMGS